MGPSDRIPPRLPEIELSNLGASSRKPNEDYAVPFVTSPPPTLNYRSMTFGQILSHLHHKFSRMPDKLAVLCISVVSSIFNPFFNARDFIVNKLFPAKIDKKNFIADEKCEKLDKLNEEIFNSLKKDPNINEAIARAVLEIKLKNNSSQ